MGFDISHYNQVTDWKAAHEAGHDFVYIKATEGMSEVDPALAGHIAGARSVGMKLGIYHYVHCGQGGIAQAWHLLAAAKAAGYKPESDLKIALDLEDPEAPNYDLQETRDMIIALSTELYRSTQRLPVIYGNRSWLDTYLGDGFGGHPLWFASPGNNPEIGTLPGGWDTWAIWQYDWKGVVPGVSGDIDMDRLHDSRTLEELAR